MAALVLWPRSCLPSYNAAKKNTPDEVDKLKVWWGIGAAVAGVLFSLNLPLNFAGNVERIIYIVLVTTAALLMYFAVQAGAS